MNIDDLNLALAAPPHAPDPEHVYVDAAGAVWFEFTCEYVDSIGKTFVFHIWATSHEDAAARMAMLRSNATVSGQVFQSGRLDEDKAPS